MHKLPMHFEKSLHSSLNEFLFMSLDIAKLLLVLKIDANTDIP